MNLTPRSMKRPDFLARIEAMAPGERVVYHFGHLMYDRSKGQDFLNVNATACAAWDAMEAGKVHLAQIFRADIGHYAYEYVAIKRPAPYKPMEWIGCYEPEGKKHSKPKPSDPRHRAVDAGVAVGQFARPARAPTITYD